MKKLLLTSIAFALMAFGQTAAALFPLPKFQPLDNNGQIIPGGTVCVYSAGTTTPMDSYTTSAGNVANTNPVILDSSGRANIWLKNTAKLVLSQPGTGCPSTGSTIWTVDGISAMTATPTFTTVIATTFNSTATGATNAFQQQSGTFTITGAGNAAFQSVASNYSSSVGQATAPTPPGAGYAFLYYDTVIGGLRYNLGGAGWNTFAGVAGSSTQVQFNLAGAMSASANLAWDNAAKVLTVGPANTAGTGYVGTVFNSSATGATSAFQTIGGTFTITGAGNAAFQLVDSTTGYKTNGTAGIANCSVVTAGASITIRGGIVTAFTGC